MMRLAEGACAEHKPTSAAELEAGRAERGNWDTFGQWFDRTVFCAKSLAPYQSPTFRAIVVTAPGEEMTVPQHTETLIEASAEAGEEVQAQRTYFKMIQGGRA